MKMLFGDRASDNIASRGIRSMRIFAMNSRVPLAILLTVGLAVIFNFACGDFDNENEFSSDIEEYDNRFFALDFRSDSTAISDLEAHFFTTFPHDDPTEGDVVYDRSQWINPVMIELKKAEGLYLYVKSRGDSLKFDSVRLTSKAYYNLDDETPGIVFVFKGELPSARGLWPAWWLNGSMQETWIYEGNEQSITDSNLDHYSGRGRFYNTPSAVNVTDWPGAGEIDIIETINGTNVIHNTIHTCPQMCDSKWNNDDEIINCANATPHDPNSGCSGTPYETTSPAGTFACVWERSSIRFYFWSPNEEVRFAGGPLSGKPDPDLWNAENLKNEVQLLETDAECDETLHQEWQCASCDSSSSCTFKNMKVIFNITLCGKWAGAEFDDTDDSLTHCRQFIFGEGRDTIDNQFLRIEYISVSRI